MVCGGNILLQKGNGNGKIIYKIEIFYLRMNGNVVFYGSQIEAGAFLCDIDGDPARRSAS